MITRNFNLYLNAGHSVPLVINVNQYDSGEQWVFTLYNSDGTKYTPSTGAIVGIKSDGLGIINSGSVVDGNVVINETQQMTAAVGKAVFELTIDSGTHGTANFVVLVEEKPGNNADLSDSDLSLIQEALDAVNPLPTGGSVGQVLTKTENGSAWTDAGTPTQAQVAEAVADWADENITVTTGVVIDNSLSVAGAAADAKKTGDEITDLKSAIGTLSNLNTDDKSNVVSAINEVNGHFLDGIAEGVSDWLDAHPEATTTVQDGSLTEEKFTDELALKTIKDYVTPEMFGAKGDGVTDDTTAFQNALDTGKTVFLGGGSYLVSEPLVMTTYNQALGASDGFTKRAQDTNSIIASASFNGDSILICKAGQQIISGISFRSVNVTHTLIGIKCKRDLNDEYSDYASDMDTEIVGCKFVQIGTGIAFYGRGIYCHDNGFINLYASGVSMFASDDDGETSILSQPSAYGLRAYRLINNRTHAPSSVNYAMFRFNGTYTTRFYGVIIADNANDYAGRLVYSTALLENCSICNNVIVLATSDTILIENFNGLTISGNVLTGVSTDVVSQTSLSQSYQSITLGGSGNSSSKDSATYIAKNLVISSNVIANMARYGILISVDIENVAIIGNLFYGIGSTGNRSLIIARNISRLNISNNICNDDTILYIMTRLTRDGKTQADDVLTWDRVIVNYNNILFSTSALYTHSSVTQTNCIVI